MSRKLAIVRALLALILVALPGTAHAEWREASSTNFVVISNDSEKALRERVEGLEDAISTIGPPAYAIRDEKELRPKQKASRGATRPARR